MEKRNVDTLMVFRLTKRDKERIEKKAKRRGMNTSTWLRAIVLKALAA